MDVQICYLCNVSTRVLSRMASVSVGQRREATLSSSPKTEVMIIGNGDNGGGDTEKKGLSLPLH